MDLGFARYLSYQAGVILGKLGFRLATPAEKPLNASQLTQVLEAENYSVQNKYHATQQSLHTSILLKPPFFWNLFRDFTKNRQICLAGIYGSSDFILYGLKS
jgi:hypothetical protein